MNRVRAQNDAAPCRALVVVGDKKKRMECGRDAGLGLCWLVRARHRIYSSFIPVLVCRLSASAISTGIIDISTSTGQARSSFLCNVSCFSFSSYIASLFFSSCLFSEKSARRDVQAGRQ